ncbi:decarboxylase [Oceanobacillus arenosus]|uniref:Decarboxylase n=1 Tax=Oceanobacillus arenosus TaxID=1229153 RepID=A0A3D8Q008_9BACI|nr:aminotransferase class I/II-fold pyridoxal phosphate-dependent enzyme [Oceanobacillus arenosus]RDW20305.1 decarboxylase [Oceanobacillus arenosus]
MQGVQKSYVQELAKHTLTQESTPLFDALVNYAKQDVTPFDVPGHKMGAKLTPLKKVLGEMVLRMDVNSMKELDLLSHPQSVIKDAQRLAAEAFGADLAYFLINGTTVGIQAMIMATCAPGDKLIVPRNCHKSVMNALILSGANPVFVQPEIDFIFGISHGVSLEEIKRSLIEHPEARALLVTYPTYFGSMNNLKEICRLAHQYDMAVIVDSAHGAHLRYLEQEIIDPIAAGADAATLSIHKTGGSLTQSSLLLLNEGRISPSKIQKMLNMLQTTSANYLLMGSLDVARSELALHGHRLYHNLKPLVTEAIRLIENNSNYEVLKAEYVANNFQQAYDWTKLVIRVNGIGLTGFEVYTLLKEEYGIQMELAEGYVVMAVLSTADSEASINKLVCALKEIELLYGKEEEHFDGDVMSYKMNRLICTPREAFYADTEVVAIDQAAGRVSADSLMIYPPGIPLVIPGEEISAATIQQYHYYCETMGNVLTEEKEVNQIKVLKEMK